MIPRLARGTLGAVGLLALAGAGQLVAVAGVPPAAVAGRLAGALVLGALPVAVPLAVVHAVTAELRAASRDGRWQALAAMGRSPDVTLRALVLGAGLVASVLVVGEHLAFPRARAALAELRAQTALTLAPGARVGLGAWTLTRDAGGAERGGDGAVHAITGGAEGTTVLTTRSLALVPGHDGTEVRMGPGTLRRGEGQDAVTLRFTGLAGVLPDGGARLPVDARPTGRFQPRGPYEAWILLKRTIVPVLLLPLVVVAAALGVRGRAPSAWIAGGVILGAWGLVRALDGLVRAERFGLGVAGALLLGSAVGAAWLARRALA